MDAVKVGIDQIAAGDLVSLDGRWTLVLKVETATAGPVLTTSDVATGVETEHRLPDDMILLRGDSASVHRADEFVGMTMSEAESWAAALGWAFRDRSPRPGWITNDLRNDRVTVWADEDGRVVRAEIS